MCLYNCIIQTLYVRIQTTYVHIRMCTYNILGSRIDHPYTDDIRRILTRYTNIYERTYEHIRKAVFYTNALGRTNIQTHTYTFVCVCIRLNYTNTYVRARRLMQMCRTLQAQFVECKRELDLKTEQFVVLAESLKRT